MHRIVSLMMDLKWLPLFLRVDEVVGVSLIKRAYWI